MTPEEEVHRATLARQALENPIVSEALDTYEQRITELWKTSPLRDVEGREKLRQQMEAAKAFRMFLETTLESGKVAAEQIRQRSKLQQLGDKAMRPFGWS